MPVTKAMVDRQRAQNLLERVWEQRIQCAKRQILADMGFGHQRSEKLFRREHELYLRLERLQRIVMQCNQAELQRFLETVEIHP